MGSSSSSRPLQPETAKDLAGSCKRMYPLPDAGKVACFHFMFSFVGF